MPGWAQFIRRAPITSLLAFACAGVFTAMCVMGSFDHATVGFDEATLERFGALYPERAWTGQAWRLLAAALVHGDPLHFLFVVWALVALGPALESVLSPTRTLLLVVGSQVGSAATHLCFGSMAPLLGASGIACGMLGGLCVVVWRQPEGSARVGRRLLVFWGLQVVVLSLVIPGATLLGHLGGGLAGAALMIGLEPSEEHRRERAVSLAFASLLLAVAVRLALVAPERANWNVAHGIDLRNQHRYSEALPYLRRGAELGYGDYRPEMVHEAMGSALLELHERDGGLQELAEGAEGGSSAAAEQLASASEDAHREVYYLARALELAPIEPVTRPEDRDDAIGSLSQELVAAVLELSSHGEMPTAADFAYLVHVPERPDFATVATLRALALAESGDWTALRALAPGQALAASALARLDADAGTANLAAWLTVALRALPAADGGRSGA